MLGILVGSIREGRKGLAVGEWVAKAAESRGIEATVLDLKAYDVPLLTSATVPMAAQGTYDDERVTTWGKAVAACDAYIFVTPEYNHGVPGAMKNAVDSLGVEWVGKPVGFVSYGADNGVRAVEQWRQIVPNFQMYDVRQAVSVSALLEFDGAEFTPADRRTDELATLFTQLVSLRDKLS